jgi:hypothetical protein
MVSSRPMMRSFLLIIALGFTSAACGGGQSGTTSTASPKGLNDSSSLANLETELAKPLPEAWKDASIALIGDPVAMCTQPHYDAKIDFDARVKELAAAQIDKTKAALQDAGITVQESTDSASVVFSIRILANCSRNSPALVTGDVSAMPGNGAVAAKSDLFDISRFDAGKVTLALLRNETLVQRIQSK